jgi:hypothetical protein
MNFLRRGKLILRQTLSTKIMLMINKSLYLKKRKKVIMNCMLGFTDREQEQVAMT